jgi:ABC-2 type transport system permease protein
MFHFAGTLLRAALRAPRTLLIAVLTPAMILLIFWALSQGPGRSASFDLVGFMFPGVVGMSVMLTGMSQTTRICTWLEQGVFRRLAATPVPLGTLTAGAALVEVLLGVLQGSLTLALGMALLQRSIPISALLVLPFVFTLIGLVYTALGSFIAALARKPQTAASIFMFVWMPMFYIGGGFPPQILPEPVRVISPYLPTTMANELIRGLLSTGALPADALWHITGLLGYAVVLTLLTIAVFRNRF